MIDIYMHFEREKRGKGSPQLTFYKARSSLQPTRSLSPCVSGNTDKNGYLSHREHIGPNKGESFVTHMYIFEVIHRMNASDLQYVAE